MDLILALGLGLGLGLVAYRSRALRLGAILVAVLLVVGSYPDLIGLLVAMAFRLGFSTWLIGCAFARR